MANLKADSPLCRRIVQSFLDFLNSVEPCSDSDVESLEVARDCLSEAFKIDSSSTSNVPKSDSLVQIFTSKTGQNNEAKSDQSRASSSRNTNRVNQDELYCKFFHALEKINYFRTATNEDDEQAVVRATVMFTKAVPEMKISGHDETDFKNLADTFKKLGNSHMHSKEYFGAIELYTYAIALVDDNAVYYCNRAAAYTQNNQHTEAIRDCYKAIEIDPNYSKAYSRLGFSFYAQGNYRDAIDKGFSKALQLDPNNESVKGNIQAAEQKLREENQRAECGRGSGSGSSSGSWSSSNGGGSRSQGPVPPFPGFTGNMSEPFDLSSMMAGLSSGMQAGNGGPEIRVGVNGGGGQMQEEIYGALRSAFQMFQERDGTHDNSSGN